MCGHQFSFCMTFTEYGLVHTWNYGKRLFDECGDIFSLIQLKHGNPYVKNLAFELNTKYNLDMTIFGNWQYCLPFETYNAHHRVNLAKGKLS